jgi:hypothetical protein
MRSAAEGAMGGKKVKENLSGIVIRSGYISRSIQLVYAPSCVGLQSSTLSSSTNISARLSPLFLADEELRSRPLSQNADLEGVMRGSMIHLLS